MATDRYLYYVPAYIINLKIYSKDRFCLYVRISITCSRIHDLNFSERGGEGE